MTCEQCTCGEPIYYSCTKDETAMCQHCGKVYRVDYDGKLMHEDSP